MSKAAPEDGYTPASLWTYSSDGHTPASLWAYSSADRESAHRAEWIGRDIASSNRSPADFALVASQKVADYEQPAASMPLSWLTCRPAARTDRGGA